jgi:hypothetical protein
MPAIPGLQKCVSHFFGLLALRPPLVNDWRWPAAGFASVDFIAALPTASLHLQRLLSGRQIEKSYEPCQSDVEVPIATTST